MRNKIQIEYTLHDMKLIDSFLINLKNLNGDWSKHGLQRIIRLNSECSNEYLSLRHSRIRADVPYDEAFRDPYSNFLLLLLIMSLNIYSKLFILFIKLKH